jgi:drug/metabolite transporter (DMT)-like permease
MKLHPALAFGFAILVCIAWIALFISIVRETKVSSITYAIVLFSVVVAGGAFQFVATRGLLLSRPRRAAQVAVASILAPSLAGTLLYLGWVLVLGHGE